MFQFVGRAEKENVYSAQRMGEEHPLATKWKQDTNVAFAKWHCAEPAVIKPPFHQ